MSVEAIFWTDIGISHGEVDENAKLTVGNKTVVPSGRIPDSYIDVQSGRTVHIKHVLVEHEDYKVILPELDANGLISPVNSSPEFRRKIRGN